MAAIGKVEYRMHDKFIGLYRDGMLFAKIHAEKLYLTPVRDKDCINI